MPKLLFFLLYEVNYKLDRAVIRTEDIGMDCCLFQFLIQAFRCDKIVNTPSGVLLARLKPVRPPGIDAFRIRIEKAERISEAGTKKFRHLGAFLIRETGILAVRLRILEVNLFVCNVQVAAEDDGFCLVKLL